MHDQEPAPAVRPALLQAVVNAAVACFLALLFCYWAARPVVDQLEVRWARWLAYAIIPMAITFTMLYRSCWHREITGAARTLSLLLLCGLILGGELIAIAVMLCLLLFGMNAITGGFHY